jgi:CHAT domain-containing protein
LLDDWRLVAFVRYARRLEALGSSIDLNRSTLSYAAFVLRNGTAGVDAIDLGPAHVVDGLIERWLKTLAGQDAESISQSIGDSLRAVVLDFILPAADRARRIVVVPDGAIATLPIEALPARGGGYVIEQLPPLSYLTAERDLIARTREVKWGRGLLVMGDPDFVESRCAEIADESESTWTPSASPIDDSHERLPVTGFRGATSHCREFREMHFNRLVQSGAEAREVASSVRNSGEPCMLLLGREASEESFKRFATGRRWLHVATHGFSVIENCGARRNSAETALKRSGLALAGANSRSGAGMDREDGMLTAEEAAMLNLSGVECVVLSACESGTGQVVSSEGVLGMRRAFYEAGASTLVAPLWKIEDSAARSWMREFYSRLLRHEMEPADAARAASLELLGRMRRLGGSTTPQVWSGFVVSGLSGWDKEAR